MDILEERLRQTAIYAPGEEKISDIPDILSVFDLQILRNQGMLSRVFRVVEQPWVMKEAKWNLDFKLFGDVKLTLPSELTEKVLKDRFLPWREEIWRQYEIYLRFARYFGYFDTDEVYYHPHREEIFFWQKEFREGLHVRLPMIVKKFGIKDWEPLEATLDRWQNYNFLPKEYLLLGQSISTENKGKETSFIFQEYVEGKPLHDWQWNKINEVPALREQLMLLSLLTLLFYLEERLVLDTRPKYPVLQLNEWLLKTDNILVSSDGLKFIDTRWCWETDENIIKRGFLIPDAIILQTKQCLQRLLKR